MKKTKVVLVELSERLDDGSRKTIQTSEICSCGSRGTAELILHLLREQPSYKRLCNDKTAKDNERMFFLSTL